MKCRYRVRLPRGWEKVPCGADAVEGAEHCARHHRRCHDPEDHPQHTWTPAPPAHQTWDKPGSLTCPGGPR